MTKITPDSHIQQIVNYMKRNLSKGYTIESLKWSLISQGYSRSEVDRAISLTHEELAKEVPKLEEKPIIRVEREPILQEIEKTSFKQKIKSLFRNLKEFFKS